MYFRVATDDIDMQKSFTVPQTFDAPPERPMRQTAVCNGIFVIGNEPHSKYANAFLR